MSEFETKDQSTIIEEVQNQPAEEPAAVVADAEDGSTSFMEDIEKTFVTIRNGNIVTGKVVSVNENEVCVNIGYKSDGIIPRREFSNDADVVLANEVKEGDEIEVEVVKVNDGEGNVLLSKKNVDAKRQWKQLLDDFEEGKVFVGVGKQTVKGGLIANINGIRAFIPASHLDTKYVDDIDEYIGMEMKLKIVEVERHRRRCVASRKAVLIEEEAARKREKWEALQEGAVVNGVVRRLTDFGAFVDIGGIDGLVHVTDLAWGRVKHPRDVVSIGQEIEVVILKVDQERDRVSLGYKQLHEKPWDIAKEKYMQGDIIQGRVVRIVPFGAFVEIEPGLDGLVHISQIAEGHVDKVESVLEEGQIVDAKILAIDAAKRRISLSIRQAQADLAELGEYDEEEYEEYEE